MTVSEDNKLLTRRFYEEVVAKGQVELLDTLAAADIFDHAAEEMGWAAGRAGFVEHIQWLHGGVSEPVVTIEDLIAEGDCVVAYWTCSGTHSGDFFGVPATGKTFVATAVSRLTFKDGQLIDYMVRPDALSVLQQLGAIPA